MERRSAEVLGKAAGRVKRAFTRTPSKGHGVEALREALTVFRRTLAPDGRGTTRPRRTSKPPNRSLTSANIPSLMELTLCESALTLVTRNATEEETSRRLETGSVMPGSLPLPCSRQTFPFGSL